MENPQPAPHLTPQRYETPRGLATRQIIDTASYNTTPSTTPPPPTQLSHVFSAQDSHRAEPSVAALADADHTLLQKTAEHGRRNSSGVNYLQAQQRAADARKGGVDEEGGSADGSRNGLAQPQPQHQSEQQQHPPGHAPHGIIPPYMLKSIAASERAGSPARDSARQTLAAGTAGRDARRPSRER